MAVSSQVGQSPRARALDLTRLGRRAQKSSIIFIMRIAIILARPQSCHINFGGEMEYGCSGAAILANALRNTIGTFPASGFTLHATGVNHGHRHFPLRPGACCRHSQHQSPMPLPISASHQPARLCFSPAWFCSEAEHNEERLGRTSVRQA